MKFKFVHKVILSLDPDLSTQVDQLIAALSGSGGLSAEDQVALSTLLEAQKGLQAKADTADGKPTT